MNDEELGQLLRDEVPAPKPGYWDAIDASLGVADPVSIEETSPDMDTDDNLVRLTPMTFNPIMTRGRREAAWIALVAAGVVIIGGFAFVLNLGAEEATTSEAGSPADTAEASSDQPSVDGSAAQTDEANDDDGDAVEPDTNDIEPSVSWKVVADGAVDFLREPGDDGETIFELPAGRELGGTGEIVELDGSTWVEVVEGQTNETGWVSRSYLELANTGSAEPEQTLVRPTSVDIEEGEPAVWDFDDVVAMNHRRDPGTTSEIIGYWLGEETNLQGTGRTAMLEGERWIELEPALGNDLGWVIASALKPSGTESTGPSGAAPSDERFEIVEGDRLLWDITADQGTDLWYEPTYDSDVFTSISHNWNMVWGSGRTAIVDGEEWVELNLFHESTWAPAILMQPVGSAPGFSPADPPPGWIALDYADQYDWVTVSEGGANIRETPDVDSFRVGSLANGEEFGSLGLIATVDGEQWVFVEGAGDEGGWVSRWLVEPTS